MRDFDAERDQRVREREARFSEQQKDRSFKIGGEVFEYRLFIPYAAADAIFGIDSDSGLDFITDRINKALPMLVEDDAEILARLEKVKHKVEIQDFRNLIFWIMGEIAERPTVAPTPSGDGRETTGTSSTEPSSSDQEEAAVSAA